MKLRHELSLAWAALVVVQVLTLIGAVGLLARVTPAVSNILADNEFSIEAAEVMLVELTAPVDDADARQRFETALESARANVTEDGELEQLRIVAQSYEAALHGDALARRTVATALAGLTQINRRAMVEASSSASDLGRTGAWAAAVLGLFSLASAITIAHRLEQRVVEPTESFAAAVQAICGGDDHRKCPNQGPVELVALAQGIEQLRERRTPTEPKDPFRTERALLLALLDQAPGSMFIVDNRGEVLSANVEGTNALLQDSELSQALPNRDAPLPRGWGRLVLSEYAHLLHMPSGASAASAPGVAEDPSA